MPGDVVLAMHDNIEAAKAVKELMARASCSALTPRRTYELTLAITGSREEAEDAMIRAEEDRLRRGLPSD